MRLQLAHAGYKGDFKNPQIEQKKLLPKIRLGAS